MLVRLANDQTDLVTTAALMRGYEMSDPLTKEPRQKRNELKNKLTEITEHESTAQTYLLINNIVLNSSSPL